MRRTLLALALTSGALSGCAASNVLDRSQREVRMIETPVAWGPVDAARLPGSYASERIDGPAAAHLREVRYVFHEDGSYTGAALIQGERRLEYQTLSGTWTLHGDWLVLDGQTPGASIEMADGRLKITSDSTTMILRSFELR